MSVFDTAHAFTARWEGSDRPDGGLVDHPRDPGGITRHGIALRTFLEPYAAHSQANRDFLAQIGVLLPASPDSIRAMTREQARRIMRRAFWDAPLRLDEFPPLTAIATFDAAVNSGNGQAVRFVQRACNALAPAQELPLVVDGLIGPLTRARVAQLGERDAWLALACIDAREAFLMRLETFPTFGAGWLNRTRALRRLIAELAGGGEHGGEMA